MTNPVADAIFKATSDPRIREAMLLGSDLESGFNVNAVGDQGTSFGPYQIHLPAHPGVTRAQASDPQFSTNFMLPAYSNAVNAQGQLWFNNGELAAEQSAVAAERPARSYIASQGQQTVDSKWAEVQKMLAGHLPTATAPVDTNVGGNLSEALSTIGDVLTKIGSAVDTIMTFITTKLFLPSTWARVLSFSIGSVLVIVGLWLFFSHSGTAANVASKAAGAVK